MEIIILKLMAIVTLATGISDVVEYRQEINEVNRYEQIIENCCDDSRKN